MLKKFILFCVVLFFSASAFATPIGVFDYADDVGRADGKCVGYGITQYVAADEYRITASGADIWGNQDGFHLAYKQMTGDVRLTMKGEFIMAPDGWTKMGPMIRNGTPGNIASDAVNYFMLTRRGYNRCTLQERATVGAGTGKILEIKNQAPVALGIQRVTSGAYTIIQGLADFGSGWVQNGLKIGPAIDDEALFGVALTAHKNGANDGMAQARITDVVYDTSPSLLGVVDIPEAAKVDVCPSQVSGFLVRTIKAGAGTDFNGDRWTESYPKMNEILDTGSIGGVAGVVEFGAYRIEEFVNFDDGGDGFAFNNGNGFPGHSYPGIDPEPVAIAPADTSKGDGDDQFAAEALGCIYLTAGLHILGAKGDDGAQLKIGDVLVGQTTGWNNQGQWLVDAAVEGWYPLEARFFEQGGGAPWELYEWLPDGTRILLNDVAAGGSPVLVPEPATIALLGFGGLTLLRMRKKR
jgi:hypothetical protein